MVVGKVKFVTGWSNPGGSTTSIIALVLALTEEGFDVEMYGPQKWHIGILASYHANYKGFDISKLSIESTDTIIGHFITLPKIRSRKRIYWCHEMPEFMPLTKEFLSSYDSSIFVSIRQLADHGVVSDNTKVIHNIVEDLSATPPHIGDSIAGIIGSIDRNKNTHVSIQNAIDNGHTHIKLFGSVTDEEYFNSYIRKYCESGLVDYPVYIINKQQMYDSITHVYHSSDYESFNLVFAECKLTGTVYMGNITTPSNTTLMTKKEIIRSWKDVL